MHSIEEVFGKGCNLYKDVLKCKKDADKASLRKAYYRAALKFHPDKNPDNPEAAKSFQAVSLAYQILQDPELKEEYDDTGVIPHNDALNEDNDDKSGADAWKQYFDQIFGKVTVSKINDFAVKYKCSDEERRDVIKEFIKTNGNLVKMLDFVMLSEPRDAIRWVDDYIKPAMESKEIKANLKDAMETSLKKIQKLIEKGYAEENMTDDDGDEEATETEEDCEAVATPSSRKRKTAKASTGKKNGKSSSLKAKAKKKAVGNSMDDLVAQIQNKKKGGGNLFSDLGARYGVSMNDDKDPLSDADFVKAQAQVDKKRKKR